MSLETNPIANGTVKVNEDKLASAKAPNATVTITTRKSFWGRVQNYFSFIHFDKPHFKLFGLVYLRKICELMESVVSLVTLCLWIPTKFSLSLQKRIAVQRFETNKLHDQYMEIKEAKEKGEVVPVFENKKESEQDKDENMKRFIAALKNDTVYDTFGNPINVKKI